MRWGVERPNGSRRDFVIRGIEGINLVSALCR